MTTTTHNRLSPARCVTKEDAKARLLPSRMGSLGNAPTLEYLQALRAELYSWIDRVDAEIARKLGGSRD